MQLRVKNYHSFSKTLRIVSRLERDYTGNINIAIAAFIAKKSHLEMYINLVMNTFMITKTGSATKDETKS